MDDILSDFYEEHEFGDTKYCLAQDHDDDLFSILENGLEDVAGFHDLPKRNHDQVVDHISKQCFQETASVPKSKRPKPTPAAGVNPSEEENRPEEQQRMSHIAVERNRRKQMNDSLSVLRSLMPHFYVKRGDQASIIAGVIDYINEMHQVLKCLEDKKHRKVNYMSEVLLSPKLQAQQVSSPRPSPARSPIKLPPSPRLNLAVSPRTPQPCNPYKPWLHQAGYLSLSTTMATSLEPSPSKSSSYATSSINESTSTVNELAANSKSPIAEVEVNFSGPNLLLKTVSPRIPGQAVKIISALQELSLQILHLSIRTVEETVVNSFTIEVGIECQLSAEELAQQIQQTFSIY
ncbi:transcription factor SPEECHLESS-like [Juglans microcarpa x Juglans regia]|uniref:transcription factor SPEECHLESS-like n=1 Tax=Juglans microcarpa x Juglans regia TaxID=2249226 RepID=UPI001B7F1E84|nr:transcription factor SPEECHLESS-like [Juglans microcarpa x Juglans regia]